VGNDLARKERAGGSARVQVGGRRLCGGF
jgi:hypothetical protein